MTLYARKDRTQAAVCPECGTEIRADVPDGVCPRCVAEMILSPVAEVSGDRVESASGNYRPLEKIGTGKFGVVYRAEQVDPVRREVALKILKPGMVSAEVVDRFEAERQALALMDHPSIAHVYDAGSTPDGRPYFVMELVRGVPITEHCDEKRLSIRDRLELFIDVCQAVQHAHQKGIIHRDLKPSNILVVGNGEAIPKIIDFGIAKAIDEDPSDRLHATAHDQFMGTPQYMSPEQVGFATKDVDTRADIYALGALLYELLSGSPPLPGDLLRKARFSEFNRLICEAKFPKPSQRVAGLESKAAREVAGNRSEDSFGFSRRLRGDLDWIVMRALEKDRERRYETAAGFGDDVRRYLDDEPVIASPPSAGYRLRKFVQRNRAMTAASVLVLTVLASATSVSFYMAYLAERSREDAERAWERAHGVVDRAIAKEREVRKMLAQSDYVIAVELLEKGERGRALARLARAIRTAGHAESALLSRNLLLQASGSEHVPLAEGFSFIEAPSAWFADFLEALGGVRLAEDGTIAPIEDRGGVFKRVARHVESLPGDDEWAALVRGWFAKS